MLVQEADAKAMPKPARDLASAKAAYDRDGYCVVPGVLAPDEVSALRKRIVEQAAAEKALGWAYQDSGPEFTRRMREDGLALSREDVRHRVGGANQRIYFLMNKGKILRDLITNPLLLELVEYSLGREFLLSSFTANIAKKGGDAEVLHRDAWWVPMPYRQGDSYVKAGDRSRSGPNINVVKDIQIPPAVCNMMWMLTDFTAENGATRLVPGTHLVPDNADSSVPHKIPTIPATGKAGSCLFFDGRLWHATGQNLTGEPRIGVLTHFCGPQFRQLENYFIGLDPAVVRDAPDKLLDLLGFTSWRGYGGADTLSSRTRLHMREPWIGELRLDV